MNTMELIELLARVNWAERTELGDGLSGKQGVDPVSGVEVFLLEDALDTGEAVITVEVTGGPLEGFYQMKQVN